MSNIDLEHQLTVLPEIVAKAKLEWRKASLEKDVLKSKTYLTLEMTNIGATATKINHLINQDDTYLKACLREVTLECEYDAKNETLMAAKKLASLRTAF